MPSLMIQRTTSRVCLSLLNYFAGQESPVMLYDVQWNLALKEFKSHRRKKIVIQVVINSHATERQNA